MPFQERIAQGVAAGGLAGAAVGGIPSTIAAAVAFGTIAMAAKQPEVLQVSAMMAVGAILWSPAILVGGIVGGVVGGVGGAVYGGVESSVNYLFFSSAEQPRAPDSLHGTDDDLNPSFGR